MKVKAHGQYHHMFHGGSAVGGIILAFENIEKRDYVYKQVLSGWKSKGDHSILGYVGDRDGMDAEIAKLGIGVTIKPCGWNHCKDQCKNASIDNVNHSVDLGAAFEVEFEVETKEEIEEDKKQAVLF